jgi:hypothetical protein
MKRCSRRFTKSNPRLGRLALNLNITSYSVTLLSILFPKVA